MNRLAKSLCMMVSLALLQPVSHAAETVFAGYEPISVKQIKAEFARNRGNALALIRVSGRAASNEMGDVSFDLLRDLKNKNPDNPQVLAAFVFSADSSDYLYRKGFRPGIPMINPGGKPFDPKKEQMFEQEADKAMEKAEKIAPHFWLVKQLKGGRLCRTAYARSRKDLWEEGLSFLKQATQLKPKLAMTWSCYGSALGYAAMANYVWKDQRVTTKDAVAALEMSVRVDPMRGAWLSLFHAYHFELRDAKNALRCKREFLKRWPKGRYLDPTYRAWFAKYPD